MVDNQGETENVKKEKMKIAYIVIAYMDPEQMAVLCRRLSISADVYVHINASVDVRPFEDAVKDISETRRVVFCQRRYKIVWAGYSILRAAFECLGNAFEYCMYDRVVLLTGLDYPIKSDQDIRTFFREHADIEFVHAHLITGQVHEYLYYYTCRDNKLLNKIFQILEFIQRKLGIKGKHDYVMVKGKKYQLYGAAPKWALTGDAAMYLLNFYKENKRFNRYFQLMHAPDDYYVATVLFNSGFRDSIEAGENIFKIMWLPKDKGAKILDEKDYAELKDCDQLYAKKFQSGYSEKLIRMLEEG